MPVLNDVGVVFAEWSARRTLRRLIDQFGRAGLQAARRSPGLGAALDQHVAAVRDLLDDRPISRRPPSMSATVVVTRGHAIRLAAYARSLVDEQRRGGGAVPTPRDEQWELADWAALRLLAVCHVGRDVAGRTS